MSPSHFDPYEQWLNIPPEEQPPNHYRLLGLSPFESNKKAIQTAARRQVSRIKKLHDGEHKPLAKKLLKQVQAAHNCLTDPASKTDYDKKLRKQMKSASSGGDFPSFEESPSVTERLQQKQESGPPPWIWIALGGGALALGICLIVALQLGSSPERDTVSAETSQTSSQSKQKSAHKKYDYGRDKTPRVMVRPGRQEQPQADGTIDCLDLVDINRDTIRGYWRFVDRDLQTPPGVSGALEIPRRVPEEYQLTMVAKRTQKNGSLHLILPISGARQVAVILGAFRGNLNGLSLVDNKTVMNNPTTLNHSPFADAPVKIICTVLRDRVRVTADDTTIVDWTDLTRLSLCPPWSELTEIDRSKLVIALQNSNFLISQCTLAPMTEEIRAALPEAPTAPAKPAEVAAPETNP